MPRTPRIQVFDPVLHARALAFHLGRERAETQRPIMGLIDTRRELETAEFEWIMQQPSHATGD